MSCIVGECGEGEGGRLDSGVLSLSRSACWRVFPLTSFVFSCFFLYTHTRRTCSFFLYDVASGRAVEDGTAMATQGKPRMVRYADRIQLQVTLDSARSVTNNMGAINPPSISIRYQEVAFEKLGDVQTTLRVVYTMELTGWMVAQLCFYGAAAIIGFAYSALRITSFVSRNPTREMGALEMLPFAARALSYLFTSQSWPIFIASLPLTLFWMLFYKLTNRVFYMIPPNDMLEDYLPFRIAIHVAMVCQVLRMLEIIIGQSNLRLFFVDWDKARGKLQPIRKGKSMRQSQRDRDSKSGQMSSDDAVMAPLSIWRTLFAANEWSELQTLRSTSLELTLFGIMAILHGECQSSLSVLWVSLGHSLLSQLLLDSPRAHAHFFFTCVHVITFSSPSCLLSPIPFFFS